MRITSTLKTAASGLPTRLAPPPLPAAAPRRARVPVAASCSSHGALCLRCHDRASCDHTLEEESVNGPAAAYPYICGHAVCFS